MEKKLNLEYREKDGQLFPNIGLESEDQPIGRFGRQWMDNMQRNHRQRFTTLRMTGMLEKTAAKVDIEAVERQEAIYQQMLAANPLPPTEDTLERTRHLSSLRLTAEESVMRDIVLTPR